MPKRKRKTGMEEATSIVLGFSGLVDALFQKYSGKTLREHLKEQTSRPRELPSGKETALSEPDMPLAEAYVILGLKPDASDEDIKKHYRNLAFLFHPDRGGYTEAMRLLNNAYERVMEERKAK